MITMQLTREMLEREGEMHLARIGRNENVARYVARTMPRLAPDSARQEGQRIGRLISEARKRRIAGKAPAGSN